MRRHTRPVGALDEGWTLSHGEMEPIHSQSGHKCRGRAVSAAGLHTWFICSVMSLATLPVAGRLATSTCAPKICTRQGRVSH